MGGLAGAIGSVRLDESHVDAALASLQHRGPERRGRYRGRLGHAWLALLETGRAHTHSDHLTPPGPFARGPLEVAFDGVLFNAAPLRATLERAGHVLTTNTPAEIAAEAYRRWGASCLGRFAGDWAIAIFDGLAQTLVLGRDPRGARPLVYARRDEAFYFASDVHSLCALAGWRPRPDQQRLQRFVADGIPAFEAHGETWFEDVNALPPGHIAVLTGARPTRPRVRRVPLPPAAASMIGVPITVRDCLPAHGPIAVPLDGRPAAANVAARAAELGADVKTFAPVGSSDPRAQLVDLDSAAALSDLETLSALRDAPFTSLRAWLEARLMAEIVRVGPAHVLCADGATTTEADAPTPDAWIATPRSPAAHEAPSAQIRAAAVISDACHTAAALRLALRMPQIEAPGPCEIPAFDALFDRQAIDRDRLLGPSPVYDIASRDAVAALLDQPVLEPSEARFVFRCLSAKAFIEAWTAEAPARDEAQEAA